MTGKPVILAPRRAKRTEVGKKQESICPFCPENDDNEEEIYRVGSSDHWDIRVIPNRFPFTEHHELVIHSPDHHKNFDELPFGQVELIFQTYRHRYQTLQQYGQVYIFHNHGHQAGESVHHPHTQIVVVPNRVKLDIVPLDISIYRHRERRRSVAISSTRLLRQAFGPSRNDKEADILETEEFLVFCPESSEWPDEVWIAPKTQKKQFGEITDMEITDIAFVLSRLIQIFDVRHGAEFPFNFYIYPGKNWYLRLIPRQRILGGFEVGTGISVNTQYPKETFAFIKEHFWRPDHEKIRTEHTAAYRKSI